MQTRKQSLIETCTNVGTGFILSLCLWRFVICPWMGIEYSNGKNVLVTALFTVVSIARGYVVRRIWNWIGHRKNIKKGC